MYTHRKHNAYMKYVMTWANKIKSFGKPFLWNPKAVDDRTTDVDGAAESPWKPFELLVYKWQILLRYEFQKDNGYAGAKAKNDVH